MTDLMLIITCVASSFYLISSAFAQIVDFRLRYVCLTNYVNVYPLKVILELNIKRCRGKLDNIYITLKTRTPIL